MKCSNDNGCEGELRVSHTYAAGAEKFQRASCDSCGRVYCLSTTSHPQPVHGQGAKARAARAQQDNRHCRQGALEPQPSGTEGGKRCY